jgi:8-oxo-dGTP diphosphatase
MTRTDPGVPFVTPPSTPWFSVSVDLVALTVRDGTLAVLTTERPDGVALPRSFVDPDEDLASGADRLLHRAAGAELRRHHLEQLGSYGAADRDPDGRVLAVGYLVLAPGLDLASHADAWIAVDDLDLAAMALDHATILDDGVERARAKLEYTTLATSFCSERFTMSELRGVYETVWATGLDPRNFNRKVLATEGFTVATDERTNRGGGRPARLYTAGPATVLHPPLTRG